MTPTPQMQEVADRLRIQINALQSGERLLVYSDGITEAMNEDHQQYDVVRSLKDFTATHCSLSAREFIDALVVDIKGFVGSAPQSDDITALYLVRQ